MFLIFFLLSRMSDVGLRCNILTQARFLTTSDSDMNQSLGSQHPDIMYNVPGNVCQCRTLDRGQGQPAPDTPSPA